MARAVHGYPVTVVEWRSWTSPVWQGIQDLPRELQPIVLRLAREILKEVATYARKSR